VEWTLAQSPRYESGEYLPAYFEVMDLTNDPRWSDRKLVANSPNFRYFCGVPLRTENEINIGCLFLMDVQAPEVRGCVSSRNVRLLTACAKNIMTHLQTVREAHERRRVTAMVSTSSHDPPCQRPKLTNLFPVNVRSGFDQPERPLSKASAARVNKIRLPCFATPEKSTSCFGYRSCDRRVGRS